MSDFLSITGAAGSANASAATSQRGLADDFSTFLTLLTTQLQNQDPTSPMDTNEFTNQLVQFSGVEQQIRTNQNLEDLATLIGAQNFNASASLLGQDALLNGADILNAGSGGKWRYGFTSEPDDVTLRVLNSNGIAVYEQLGAKSIGIHDFEWDGLDREGNPVPEGTYTLDVRALNDESQAIAAQVYSTGRVTGVTAGIDEPLFDIGAQKGVTQKDILQLIANG